MNDHIAGNDKSPNKDSLDNCNLVFIDSRFCSLLLYYHSTMIKITDVSPDEELHVTTQLFIMQPKYLRLPFRVKVTNTSYSLTRVCQ